MFFLLVYCGDVHRTAYGKSSTPRRDIGEDPRIAPDPLNRKSKYEIAAISNVFCIFVIWKKNTTTDTNTTQRRVRCGQNG